MMGENDWTSLLVQMESDVFDAFMELVSIFEEQRDLAYCFRPLTLGHPRQQSEPLDSEQLLIVGQHDDLAGNAEKHLLSLAA